MRINFMRDKPLPVFVVSSWRMKFYVGFAPDDLSWFPHAKENGRAPAAARPSMEVCTVHIFKRNEGGVLCYIQNQVRRMHEFLMFV